jgi:GWxTD domain-containing protein
MQPYCFRIVLALLASGVYAQPLRDINFSYLYDYGTEFSLVLKPYSINRQPVVHIEFSSTNPSKSTLEYALRFELRNSIDEKGGRELPEPEWLVTTDSKKTGRLPLDNSASGQLVVASVILNSSRKAWYYYQQVPEATTFALLQNNLPATRNFIRINELISFSGFEPDKPLIVSLYKTDFPAAAPPFSTAQARVSPTLKPDSVFTLSPAETVRFSTRGLYLIQQDTTGSAGLAFRIEVDYPKLGKIETLTAPMIYVCEKKEMEKLRAAKGDKLLFDKTIIGITGSTDRAKAFIRNYFRRVEQANILFTSYKEGWKTDRGMVYIIYGPPEEVYRLGNREVWEYKNDYYKGRIIFTKAGTLFDPENYVLIRDRKFTDTWYQLVDLWRKARF